MVLDLELAILLVVFVFGTLVAFVLFVIVASLSLAQDLRLELLIRIFMLLPFGIYIFVSQHSSRIDTRTPTELEDIESILNLHLIIKTNLVRDLILLFHQVQLFPNGRVVLVLVLPDLEEYLDHVLRTLVDISLVQNVPELIENSQGNRLRHFLQMLADFPCQPHRNLNTVIRRLVEQEKQNLSSKHFVNNLLVDQMGKEGGRRQANSLIITLERLAELYDQSGNQQLADLGKLRVDNGHHSRVDGRERQRSGLGLHDAPTKQTASTDQVLVEQLGHDVLNVGHVDLVDQTVDRLLQSLPCHALVFLAALVRDLGL